jgi:hypothetical protein
MKLFACEACGSLLFFENVSCLRCQHPLGFLPERMDLSALEKSGDNLWKPLGSETRYRPCQNALDYQVCNWLVDAGDPHTLCRSCRLNLMIPDLTAPGNMDRWRKLELAKRRALYWLLRFNLGTEESYGRRPLRFKFLAETPNGPPIMTGHEQGIITINIAEADDAEREKRRVALHEPLRTLLGHVRHEIAHYYWDRLIQNTPHIDKFRATFGDERRDYAQSLQSHYQQGPPADWPQRYVTSYASSHPWEDWAETWAHYIHITDTLETSASFGLSLRPEHQQAATMRSEPNRIQYLSRFEEIMEHWLPLTYALNEVNRGMGQPDLYPFVLSGPALEKLRFVHQVLH